MSSWYDQQQVQEWKSFLTQPYCIKNILNNSDNLMRELHKQCKEIGQFLTLHQEQIIIDAFKLILMPPSDLKPNNPQQAYSSKALEFIAPITQGTISILYYLHCNQKHQIKFYIRELFRIYKQESLKVQVVNLYHGYFQRLFNQIFGIGSFSDIVFALEEQQITNQFLQILFKNMEKQAIANCIERILIVDLKCPANFSWNMKSRIVNKMLEMLKQFRQKEDMAISMNEEAVERILQIYMSFLRNSGLIYDCDMIYKGIYESILANIRFLESNQVSNSIKVLVLEILMFNQIKAINILSFKTISQQNPAIQSLTSIFYAQPLKKYTIVHQAFINFLAINLKNRHRDINSAEEYVNTLIKNNFLQKTLCQLLSNPTNNIMASSIQKLIFAIFCTDQFQSQILRTNNEVLIIRKKVQMKLILYTYECLRKIQGRIVSNIFSSFKNQLFMFFVKIFQLLNLYSEYFICAFSNEDGKQFKDVDQIIVEAHHWKIFYKNYCFPALECMKTDLGSYNFTVPPHQVSFFITDKCQKQKVNENVQPLAKADEENYLNFSFSIQSNHQQNVLPSQIQQLNDEAIKQLKIEKIQETKSNIPIEIEPNQNIQESYQCFLKKKMVQIDKNIKQSRSKSKTPGKVKASEIKKTKNKWNQSGLEEIKSKQAKPLQFTPKSVRNKEAINPENLPKEKIQLIRVDKSQKPLKYKQRVFEAKEHVRLNEWLLVSKKVR